MPSPLSKNVPSVELLKATHTFPGLYTIKAIGLSEGAFVARVVAAAREAIGNDVDPPYHCRESEGNAHIAITLDLDVKSAEMVRDIYERLLHIPGLLLLL